MKSKEPIPVKEGDELEVEIISIGKKGDGVAKIEGFILMIPGTELGDKPNVRIIAIRGRVGFAEVIE